MDKEIAKRIIQIRKENKMTQTEFAKKLNATRPKIAAYELAKVNFDSSFLALICERFNINENWLQTGEGDMFVETTDSIIAELAIQYNLDELDQKLIREYAKLDANQKNAIKQYINNVLKNDELAATQDSEDEVELLRPAKPLVIEGFELSLEDSERIRGYLRNKQIKENMPTPLKKLSNIG